MVTSSSPFGLRKRLLLIGVIAILPALLLVLDAYREERQLARAAAENQALAAVFQVAGAQANVINQVKAQAAMLAEVPVVRRGSPPVCGSYVSRVLQRQPDMFANVGRLDPDGRVRCSAIPIEGAEDVSHLYSAQRALTAKEVKVGRYEYGPIVEGGVVAVTAPILDPQGEVLAAAYISIDLGWLREVFARAEVPAGTELTLLDQQGIVLARFPNGRQAVGGPAPPAQALLRAAQERAEGGIVELPGESERIYAIYHLPNEAAGGLLVYAEVPAAAIYAAVDDQLLQNLLGVLLALAVMLGGSLLAGFWLVVRPVQRLQGASQRLADGELGARAELKPGRDEVAQLGLSFDRMAANLQERDAALRAHQALVMRLNRIYTVLSSINGLIIRAARREELLAEACRIAVEQGGFGLAWIGLLEPAGQRLASVWQAGDEAPARQALVPPVGLAPQQWPELAGVFAQGRALIHPPPGQAPRWQAQAPELRERSYAACAVLPLKLQERVVGCLALYAGEAGAFDAAEMKLLEETAADLSHALSYLDQAERLAYLASNDPLTGLPNADRFRDRLALALKLIRGPDAGLAVMMIAIHGLREVNSVHGLPVGDRLLREIAARIRDLLPAEAILGRLRSSVFGVVLPRAGANGGAGAFAEHILEAFGRPFRLDGLELYMGIRIGISMTPTDGTEAEMLMQYAETALSSLRGQVGHFRFYTAQLQQQAEQRMRLEHALRQALKREDELHLLYQPVVAVASRRLVGVEALLRWRHPQLGELPPSQFIPVAEAAGLMASLGEWVLTQACRQARAWADAGLEGFKVAVNVSVSQLRHEDFLETVDAVIRHFRADPRHLVLGLEITESELMEDAPRTIELLNQLKARGFALSMDDFGTGYSSLAYLRRFPLDTLKIDIAFIRDLARDEVSVSIVQAIIALARALDLITIAEGVETAAQFELLARYGCDSVQGHLFGQARPPEAIPALVGRPLSMGEA